jgi:ParB-like chromosome segregation protein Spo0J
MKILEHNVETNEVIERDMTDAELVQYEIDEAAKAANAAAQEEKATARQAVLDRLGLTEEEAQLILGGSN